MIEVHFFVGSRYPVNRQKIRACVERLLKDHQIDNARVDISIVGKRKIQALNKASLNHDGETDVLSFPQHERHQLHDVPLPPHIPPHLGDIVVSFPEAVNTAKKHGKLVDDQICFYVEHALHHLLGYHHD